MITPGSDCDTCTNSYLPDNEKRICILKETTCDGLNEIYSENRDYCLTCPD